MSIEDILFCSVIFFSTALAVACFIISLQNKRINRLEDAVFVLMFRTTEHANFINAIIKVAKEECNQGGNNTGRE